MRIYLFGIMLWMCFCYQAQAQITPLSLYNEIASLHTSSDARYSAIQSLAQQHGQPKSHTKDAFQTTTGDTTNKPTQIIEQHPVAAETHAEDYQRRGIVIALKRIKINARSDAVISKLHIKAGELFKKDDLLIEFDCSVERAAIEEARLTHEVAKFNYELKKRDAAEGLLQPQELELLKLKTDLALTKLNHQRERIKNCRLLAPFSGRVIKIPVSVHETVATLTPIMEVVDNQPLHFRVFLPWKWLEWLTVGDLAEIEIMEKNYPAELVELSQEADPLDQSIKALLKLQSQDGLIIGMNGIAKFNRQTTSRH